MRIQAANPPALQHATNGRFEIGWQIQKVRLTGWNEVVAGNRLTFLELRQKLSEACRLSKSRILQDQLGPRTHAAQNAAVSGQIRSPLEDTVRQRR